MSATDYRAMYEEYWSRPDRWGSHSFTDARGLARQVMSVCGNGRTLDVGCGMGLLVHTLLSMSADVVGCDVAAACVGAGNRSAPGRFVQGSMLALPFENASFDTVVSTDVFEHLAESDVDRAVAELARVARSSIFVRLATAPDREGKWHLTVKPREWWEDRFIQAGLRKHPEAHRAIPYDTLDREGHQITLVFEKMPAGALARHSLKSLRAGRDLHMDMLREAGRRSDAHLARYVRAAAYVRPGDTVLDAACGMGYGSAILARNSAAARVIGVDLDKSAVKYATDCFGGEAGNGAGPEFRAAALPDLSFLADQSVDLIASFETLEHVPDPGAVLREFRRVLTPGGRVVVSVPNDWTDETGKDPNPHHFHVYTWDRLAAELSKEFLIENAAAQTAGGGMKLSDRPRRFVDARFVEANDRETLPTVLTEPPEAEWWIAVAMKSPIGAGKQGYRETTFGEGPDDPAYHLTAFARDYDNPWLVRSMVSIGMRAARPDLLRHLAREVLRSARPGSADAGAALCVLAYAALDRFAEGKGNADEVSTLTPLLSAYPTKADDSAHAWRWSISNQYALGSLLTASGDRTGALGAFEACAVMDCTRFSPLLASKTIDAAFQAGSIYAADGDAKRARRWWSHGVAECRRVLSGPWLNVVRDETSPVHFGLPEVATVADLASRCAYALGMLDRRPARSGQVWTAANTLTHAEAIRWLRALQQGKSWIEEQFIVARENVKNHARVIEELRAWSAKQDEGRAWLEGEVAARDKVIAEEREASAELARRVREESQHREKALADAQQRIAQVSEGMRWHEEQARSAQAAVRERDEEIVRLREWAEQLSGAKTWLDRLRLTMTDAIADRDRTLTELRDWNAKLTEGRDFFEAQAKAWEQVAADRDRTLTELRDWNAKLTQGRDFFEAQSRSWEKAVAEHRAMVEELRAWNAEMTQGKEHLEGQVKAWEKAAAESKAALHEAHSWAAELTAGRDFHAAQAKSWEAQAAAAKAESESLRAWTTELKQGCEFLEAQAKAWERTAREREAEATALRERVGALEGTAAQFSRVIESLQAHNDELDRRLTARVRPLHPGQSPELRSPPPPGDRSGTEAQGAGAHGDSPTGGGPASLSPDPENPDQLTTSSQER